VPEREFVRGVTVLVKSFSYALFGAFGAKAPDRFASHAALKRRSSMVLHVQVVLDF
jgi:hypothetical protein